MKPHIIDTSVAVKWFVDEEGPSSDRAHEYLEKIRKDPSPYVVPELFFNEMLAVFCRLVKEAERIQGYVKLLEDLGFERVGNGRELLATAAVLSERYSLTGYDAVFVAVAKLMGGLWVTSDHAAAVKLKGSGLVVDLGM